MEILRHVWNGQVLLCLKRPTRATEGDMQALSTTNKSDEGAAAMTWSMSASSTEGVEICPNCGGKVRLLTAKTRLNYGRRFYRCQAGYYNAGYGCPYFQWMDPVFGDRAHTIVMDLLKVNESIEAELNVLRSGIILEKLDKQRVLLQLEDIVKKVVEDKKNEETENNPAKSVAKDMGPQPLYEYRVLVLTSICCIIISVLISKMLM